MLLIHDRPDTGRLSRGSSGCSNPELFQDGVLAAWNADGDLVDVGRAFPIRTVDDLRPIGRPDRVVLVGGVRMQACRDRPATSKIHTSDVPVRRSSISTAARAPSGEILSPLTTAGSPSRPSSLPCRSSHMRRDEPRSGSVGENARRRNGEGGMARAQKTWTFDARIAGSPRKLLFFSSNFCAMSAPSREDEEIRGGEYSTLEETLSSAQVSFESRDPSLKWGLIGEPPMPR